MSTLGSVKYQYGAFFFGAQCLFLHEMVQKVHHTTPYHTPHRITPHLTLRSQIRSSS